MNARPTKHEALGAFAGIAAGLLLVLLVVVVVQNYQLTKANNRLNERIVDCTTPGRPCFDAGQKRTADAVAMLNDFTEAAVVCADRTGTQGRDETRACIIRTLNN